MFMKIAKAYEAYVRVSVRLSVCLFHACMLYQNSRMCRYNLAINESIVSKECVSGCSLINAATSSQVN